MDMFSKGRAQTEGLEGLFEVTLSGPLRQRPAGRLMQRIVREHPEASMEEVMQLFRDAVLDDPEVFDDVLTAAFTRHLPKDGGDRRD